MKTYKTIVNMTGGTFQRLYIVADNIEQARATAERLIQNIPRYRIDTITEADPESAAADVKADRAAYMTADAQAQADHPATRADYPAERDLPPAPSTTADTDSAQATPDTSTNTQPHKGHQRRATTAPQTVEEALQRIHNINLNEVTGPIDGLYHRAIRQYLDEGKPWQLDIDWAIFTGYAIGIQEGRRRERQRRKHSAPAI